MSSQSFIILKRIGIKEFKMKRGVQNETIYKNLLKGLQYYSEKSKWEPVLTPYVQQMLAFDIHQIAESIQEQLKQNVHYLTECSAQGIQGFYFNHLDFVQGGGATTIAVLKTGINLSEDSSAFRYSPNMEVRKEWSYNLAFRLEFASPYYHYLNDYMRSLPSSGTEMPPKLREMFEEWDGLTESFELAHHKGYLALHFALQDWIPTLKMPPNLLFVIEEHGSGGYGTVVYISE